MSTTEYDKLVRDKIPEIIEQTGKTPIVHTATSKEYRSKLIAKLGEEVNEFIKDPNPEELADIQEVVLALADVIGVTAEGLDKIRQAKADKRGGFEKRIILERVNE